MELTGKIVKLRAIELADADFLRSMINSQGIEAMTTGSCFPVSDEKQMEWIRNRDEQKDLKLMIQIIGGETIGMVSVESIDWKNRTAGASIKIGTIDGRVENDAYEACLLTLHYCFHELNLHSVTSELLSNNHLSKKLNKKCGFVEEGILRERIYKKGRYHDVVRLSILRSEFEQSYTAYKKILSINER